MILRRIANALKRQDWATVGVEFVLIIAGVLIALQVNNWNENRQARAQERVYLERLYYDLERSREDTRGNFEFMSGSADDASFIVTALRDCSLSPDDKDRFATGMFRLGKLAQPTLIDTTLEELKSTGSLRVLTGPGLVEEIVDLQRWFDADARSAQYIEDWSTNQLAIVHSKVGFEINDTRVGASAVGWDELVLDLDDACRDDGLKKSLSAIRMYTVEMAWRNQRADDRLRAAQEIVAAALDSRVPGWREAP